MEQSPLSRAIREMERLLGVRLFERTTRSTRITRAGRVLLEHAQRVIAVMEQARASVRSAALGHSKQLRIGLSDCTAYSRLSEILARYRIDEPAVFVSISEIPLAQQIKALRDDLLDASITLNGEARDGIVAEAVWQDPIFAVLPALHPLVRLTNAIPVDLNGHPLILFGAESDIGGGVQIDNFVNTLANPCVADRASSLGVMLTMVGLGNGIGLVGASQMAGVKRTDVVLRPLGGAAPALTTYVLHADCGISEPLSRFIDHARALSLTADPTAVLS